MIACSQLSRSFGRVRFNKLTAIRKSSASQCRTSKSMDSNRMSFNKGMSCNASIFEYTVTMKEVDL